jgi:hypothetical protein
MRAGGIPISAKAWAGRINRPGGAPRNFDVMNLTPPINIPLLGALLAALVLTLALTAPAATLQPETLHYTVDAPLIKDAGRATVSLRQVDPENFEGEIRGETNGVIAFFTSHRRDCYRTTMRLTQGRLQPQVYTEESWRKGKHHLKEYRFDYNRRRLELWQKGENGVLALKWQTELTEPIYDPISAFYNFRLGALGEIKGGDTITVSGVPYPRPEEIIIRIGPQESGNRKATVSIRNRAFEDESGLVHIQFDDQLVPLSAWTRVLQFGKLSGRLTGKQ